MPAHGSLLLALTTAAVVAAGSAASAVEPTEAPGDTTAPAVSVVAVVPGAVTVTEQAAPVVVTARVADAGSGVTAVSVRLDGGEPFALAPLSGDTRNGSWSGFAALPRGHAHGLVTVNAEARDGAGNVGRYAQVAARVNDAAPAAPADVTAVAEGGTLRVAWEAPAANGASPAEGYTVAAEPLTDDPAVVVRTTARSASLPGLPDGRYVVRVSAHNATGSGPDALADATVGVSLAAAAPSAPRELRAVPHDGAVEVTWAPVPGATAYEVRAADTEAEPLRVTGTSATLQGLANGVAHDVVVTSVGEAARGLSAHVRATPRRVPDAPALGAVSAGDHSATVRWTAPADGGDAIHGYVVTAHPSGTAYVVPGTATSAVVGGLANGRPATFSVTARNDAGSSPASATSGAITPRQPLRITPATMPAPSVAYGTPSRTSARLTTSGGLPVSGLHVKLQARLRPSTAWKVVSSARSDANGVVRLGTVLPGSADLRMHHAPDTVAEAFASFGTVVVTPKVTAVANTTSLPLGATLSVTGSVTPAQETGSPVLLQRWGSTGWTTIARGAMTTATAYRVSWRPGVPGTSTLRVATTGDADHGPGASPQWRQYVLPDQAAIARQIQADTSISLDARHVSGRIDNATARANIVDLAAGLNAARSSYEGAPGGRTPVDVRLLKALRRMGERGQVTVSEIAGGSHSRNSTHYSGRGLDIRVVNGVPVRRGTSYALAVEACRAFGAVRIFHPSYDPYGGHQGHVHCDWSA